LRKIARSTKDSGEVMVSLALTLPLFLFVLFGIISFLLIQYQSLALQYSTVRAVRKGVLINSFGATRAQNLADFVISEAEKYGITVVRNNVSVCPVTTPDCKSQTTGKQGDFFVIKASVPTMYTLVLSSQSLAISSVAYGINR
jgi:Flp pilus assembly protein TadG